MNTFQTIASHFGRKQLPDVDGLSRKIKLLKICIYREFRVVGRPSGGHPQGSRQAGLGVATRGRRAGGETGCHPYENVARTPMLFILRVAVLPPSPPPVCQP